MASVLPIPDPDELAQGVPPVTEFKPCSFCSRVWVQDVEGMRITCGTPLQPPYAFSAYYVQEGVLYALLCSVCFSSSPAPHTPSDDGPMGAGGLGSDS